MNSCASSIVDFEATYNVWWCYFQYLLWRYIDFSDTFNMECGISCHLDSDFCFAMDCITSYDVDCGVT